jgi:repressor LexA
MARHRSFTNEDIFKAIEECWDSGRPPTVRRLATNLETSPTNLHYHLRNLRSQGLVQWEEGAAGTIQIHAGAKQALRKPLKIQLVGMIPAGLPNDPPGQNNANMGIDWIPVDPENLDRGSPHRLFALEVYGDSMIDANIQTGDYVLIDRSETVCSGDIIAALINDEVTLKYYIKTKKGELLRPANKDWQDRPILPSDRFEIEGKVKAVVKVSRHAAHKPRYEAMPSQA